MTTQPTTMYQVAYGLGGYGDPHVQLASAVREARAAISDDDCQSIDVVAIDYPADGTDPWGIERALNQAELDTH